MNRNRLHNHGVGLVVLAIVAILLVGAHPNQAGAQEPIGDDEGGRVGAPDAPQVRVVDTGLIALQLATDAHGHFACVFGQPAPPVVKDAPRSRRDRQAYPRGGPTHVVSVDLKTLEVLARHPIDGDVEQALIDDTYLYWKPKSVNVVNRLSLTATPTFEQLSPQGGVEGMFFVGDDRLALVIAEGYTARLHIYDRASFTRLPDDPLGGVDFASRHREYGRLVRYASDDEVLLSGHIIDQNSGTIKCLVDKSLSVPSLVPSMNRPLPLAPRARGHVSWRRRDSGEEMQLLGGGAPFRIRADAWSISRDLPLFAGVIVSGGGPEPSQLLEIRDVVFGKRMDQVVLDSSKKQPTRSGIRFSGENVVVAKFDTLSIVRMTQKTLDVAEPFRMLHPRLAVGSFDRVAETRIEARGGKPPYHFSLEQPIDGVEIDEMTGLIRFDFPKIWKRRFEGVSSGEQNYFEHVGQNIGQPNQPKLTIGERFEANTGITVPLDMFPTNLPLALTGVDSGGQRDRIFVQAIVMVPKEKVEAANALSAKLRAALQARMMAERRASQQVGAVDGATEARINNIERRIRRIETQLDAILEKLDKGTAGAGRDN